MVPGFALFIFILVLSGGLVAAAWLLDCQLTLAFPRWMLPWLAKGLLVPLVLWGLMNLGFSWAVQPFMPQVQAAQNSGAAWFGPFLMVFSAGLFVVTSYWTALTLGWMLWRAAERLEGEQLLNLKSLCRTCALGMSVPALLILLVGGWGAFGLAAVAVLGPMAGWAPSVLHKTKQPPMYARAIARIKFGKYAEAEMEIIRELEKCENDFDGWMMLAELYADRFGDLAEAEQTILGICDQPSLTPTQLSVALHRLADWQLKLKRDPDAARRALTMICLRLPGTHLARMAQLRMNQLPETAEDLREQQTARPIPLPGLRDHLEDEPPAESVLEPEAAAKMANACTARLKQNPNYAPAREQLARLLAEHLGQADPAIEQLRLLLDMPDQPEAKRAEWLALTAAWHLKYRHDPAAARRALESLLSEYPESPQAFAARKRLELLDADAKREA